MPGGGGGCVFYDKLNMDCAQNFRLKKVILTCCMENSCRVLILLFKISEILLESKPFKTSRELPYFAQNQLCACLIYAFTCFAYNFQETFEKRFLLRKI